MSGLCSAKVNTAPDVDNEKSYGFGIYLDSSTFLTEHQDMEGLHLDTHIDGFICQQDGNECDGLTFKLAMKEGVTFFLVPR